MNVLFLTLYPDIAASPRYRVSQFIPHLQAGGINCTIASALTTRQWAVLTGPGRTTRPFWYHFHETRQRFGQILEAGRYDVVVVQKALTTAYLRGMGGLIRARARKLVYDIDDAVHLAAPHPLPAKARFLESPNQIARIMRDADLVLAGNHWLLDEAKRHGATAEFFPTVVDTDRFVPAPHAPECYRIGWMGNPSTMVCVEPAMEALASVEHAELTFVGARKNDVRDLDAELRPWSLADEVGEVQRFSVGIMPMPDDGASAIGPSPNWMRGKCGLKALLCMACGVPCVVSPYGAAKEFIRDGENGIFARTTEEWSAAFARLRDDGERTRMGAAARATVEAHYSLKVAGPRLVALLESIA